MSNYTIAVNWAGKDALADTDPGKIISGSDFNTEFVAARTAINSKAELTGDEGENFSCNTLTATSATVGGQTVSVLDTPQTYTKAHTTQAKEISMTANQTASLIQSDVFVVTITATSKTLSVSNLSAGAKASFIIKNTGEKEMSLASNIYLPAGATYAATSGDGSVDVLNCVSDGTSLYCSVDYNF